MPIAGKGMLITWMDIDPAEEADFNLWYDREHLAERVGIEGFVEAWRLTNFPRGFAISVFVSVTAVAGEIIVSALAAYAIVRNWDRRLFRWSFFYLLAAMFIPFPVVALPQIQLTGLVGLDNPLGVVALPWVKEVARLAVLPCFLVIYVASLAAVVMRGRRARDQVGRRLLRLAVGQRARRPADRPHLGRRRRHRPDPGRALGR